VAEAEKAATNVCLAIHIGSVEGGVTVALAEYFMGEGAELVWIRHPLTPKSGSYSEFRQYSGGHLVSSQKRWAGRIFAPLMYMRDVIYTLWWMLRRPAADLYIGADALNALAGVLLKWLGKARYTVLFTIDFVPRRFESRWLNWCYHEVDRFCLRNCDQVWDLSPRMIEGRRARDGEKFKMNAQHIIVPQGAWYSRIPRLPLEQTQRHLVGFMGILVEKQGVQLLISALQKVRAVVPQARLRVIGDGPYAQELRRQVSSLGLDEAVEFTGYVQDHREVERLLAECAFAVSLFDPDLDDFTYYADPGKIKIFLAAGLAVIMTAVPLVAQEVEAKRCGVIVTYDESSVAEAMLTLLTDDGLLGEYRANALAMAREYDYAHIFARALADIS
jgi:glycosyltransferase involved in cell wall biosynthesis